MILLRGSPISSARCGGEQRRLDHRLAGDRARVLRVRRLGVLVHQVREQLLVERAPVGADAHRLVVLDRHLDDRGELLVLLVLEADVAGIDAVLVERLGAAGMLGEQLVADVVEVADDRDVDADLEQPLLDLGHGRGGLVAVDGDAHDLGAGLGEGRDLAHGAVDVRGVGVGHRLHHDRRAAAHRHVADLDRDAGAPVAGGRRSRHRTRHGISFSETGSSGALVQ